MGQPMHGPRVAITLARFLPDGLVSAIRDGPGENVVAALEQTTETPELVWTPAMAASLSAQISTMASDLYREQMKGRVVDWDIPEQASAQQEMRDEPQVKSCTYVKCIGVIIVLLVQFKCKISVYCRLGGFMLGCSLKIQNFH